jgi:alpha-1,2-mannosyltransferase
MVMAWDAFQLLAPDIFIDTMGYAFALGLSKFLFPRVPTSAYVHYPTISTDMLESLDPKSATGSLGVNAGKGVGTRGKFKRVYWQLFAKLYSRAGSSVDIVMTNSTWTQDHIQKLWGPHRKAKGRNALPTAVYPPCAVEELEAAVDVSAASESRREKVIIYIAQFRPEKNHTLVVQAFAEFLKTESEASKGARLVLLGSVRDDHDSKRVYQLRILVNELGVRDSVDFHLDASWPEILEWLQKASVGANGMWNEHFGIGVVEYQAAGLISVVHDSGGPKLDIVVEVDGKPTGRWLGSLLRNWLTLLRLPCDISPRLCAGLRKGPFCSRPLGHAAACPPVGQEVHRGRVCEEVGGPDGCSGGHDLRIMCGARFGWCITCFWGASPA